MPKAWFFLHFFLLKILIYSEKITNFIKICNKMITEKLKKGHLLIAEPSIIGDLSFNRSVILLSEHNDQGSVGFILNKPLNYGIHDLLPEIEASFKIYNGGPMEQDNLYFIHNVPKLITDSIEISNGVYWGGDFELTKKLINEGKINKNNIRFFLGYTGWDADQLECEMHANSWIATENIYANKVIAKSSDTFWKEKIIELGGDYLVWSNAPENPTFN
jgi:putative transcriptional regulator